MIKEEIIKEIKLRIENSKVNNYAIWRIGLTQNLKLRKEQHGNPKYWVDWEADSYKDALHVENYFLNVFPSDSSKRMSGGTGGNMGADKTTYIYIY